MNDTISVEVDSVAFESAMQRLRAAIKDQTMNPQYGLLPVQARLLAERCQSFTPPIGRQAGRNRQTSTATARQAGRIAIKRDLHRIFYPISHVTFQDKQLRKIVRTNDVLAWNAASKYFTKEALRNTRAIPFSASWHKVNRISRGRARGGGQWGNKPANLGFVTLGPEGQKARAYTKNTVEPRMGWARAGWNQGIMLNSGTVTEAWIARHGMGSGFCRKNLQEANPSIWVGNTTSWARYGSEGEGIRIIRNAIATRARDIEKHVANMEQVCAAAATKEYKTGAHSNLLVL